MESTVFILCIVIFSDCKAEQQEQENTILILEKL